jgi:DNA-damage-inducible protein J
MANEGMIRVRIEPQLKAEAEDIFRELGLSITEAITLFYRQVKLKRGLPFEIHVPNETTLKTFKNTDARQEIVQCKDAQKMFEMLGL